MTPISPTTQVTTYEARRIAATECINLMALLAESGLPNSIALAALALSRLVAIMDEGAGIQCLTDEEILPWLRTGRLIKPSTGDSDPTEDPKP